LRLASEVFDQAKTFFARPLEEKMRVCTDLIPEEFCGYHPIERYNWEGSKRRDLHEAFNWNYDAARDPDWPDASIPQINL
jgi:isopenicillin N synthase-like dioxygenase